MKPGNPNDWLSIAHEILKGQWSDLDHTTRKSLLIGLTAIELRDHSVCRKAVEVLKEQKVRKKVMKQ